MNKIFKNVLSVSLAAVALAASLGTTGNAAGYWGVNYGGYGNYGNYGYSQYTQSNISLDAAKDIALKSAGVDASNAVFTKTKIDFEDDYRCCVYEIEFISGGIEYDYEIKASDGRILKSERENKWNYGGWSGWNGNQQQQQVSSGITSSGITAEQAKQIALERAGLQGANVWDLKVKSKYKWGVTTWEVEFDYYGFEYEVKVDSKGNVIDYEVERD